MNTDMGESDIEKLQALLDSLPAPLEPLDVSMLDGYLCGVLVQPNRVELSRFIAFVIDVDGRACSETFDLATLVHLVERRWRELDGHIGRREWFDPWVFELDEADAPEAVYPWVAGFAHALDRFPELMQRDEASLREPLVLLYRHLDPDDLEDADDLLQDIEMLEPPATLSEAVEEVVRATLLLADVGRPLAKAATLKPRQTGAVRAVRGRKQRLRSGRRIPRERLERLRRSPVTTAAAPSSRR